MCEHLAGALRPSSGVLALGLLDGHRDLTRLDDQQRDEVRAATDFMAARYVPGHVLDAAADAYFADIAPHITALAERLAR